MQYFFYYKGGNEMIEKLTTIHTEAVLELLAKYPAENVFLIGDVEVYGFHDPIQDVWGQFEDGKLIAILLRYDRNFIPYSERTYDVDGFARIINDYDGAIEVSGLAHVVEPLLPLMKRRVKKHSETYYAKCEALAYDVEAFDENVSYLTAPHYAENIDMLASIPEFQHATMTVETRERAETYKTGRTYVYMQDGVMVASASSTAENSKSAMIVGVGTRPGHERNGYATRCMEKLCAELLAEGKMACLFYDNPNAGNIYKRLGFVDIGMWTMVRYES